MPKVKVTRRVHFNAAHRLHNPSWSIEENRRVFGPCSNPNYHGHNYELEVSVEDEIDPETGYVADLQVVKQIVEERVVQHFDHKNLNLDLPEFQDLNPTTENLVVKIWSLLEGNLPCRLVRLVLWETPRSWVEYSGE
jgi:6-pyruvoyltetrahydropterin/6-carboxytetrahydropterin synthase